MKQLMFVMAVVVNGCGDVAGTAGPPGETGPQGPQGPAGMIDPAQVIANGATPQAAEFNITGVGVVGQAVRVGASEAIVGSTSDVSFQVTSGQDAEAALSSASDTPSVKPALFMDRSRGTLATRTNVFSGDHLGRIVARGFVQGVPYAAAALRIAVDGTPTATSVPGSFQFVTTDTTGASAERVRISADGKVGIATAAPTELLHVGGPIRFDEIRLFRKTGDNGTVSCDTYCLGSQWAGGVGACLAAHNYVDDVYVSCAAVLGLGHAVHCLCAGID